MSYTFYGTIKIMIEYGNKRSSLWISTSFSILKIKELNVAASGQFIKLIKKSNNHSH